MVARPWGHIQDCHVLFKALLPRRLSSSQRNPDSEVSDYSIKKEIALREARDAAKNAEILKQSGLEETSGEKPSKAESGQMSGVRADSSGAVSRSATSPASHSVSPSSSPSASSASSSSGSGTTANTGYHSEGPDPEEDEKKIDSWIAGTDLTGQMWRRKWVSPSRDDAYTNTQWDLHRSPWRHVRHILSLTQSATLQRLLVPDMLTIAGVSCLLSYYNTYISPTNPLQCPYIPFMLTSTALGLLLVFRTTASYQRFETARVEWSRAVNSSRSLVRTGIVKIFPIHPRMCRVFFRFIRAFPRTLVFHLTPDGDQASSLRHFQKTQGKDLSPDEIEEELSRQLNELMGPVEAKKVLQVKSNRPLRILQMMSKIVGQADLDPVISNRLDTEIRELEIMFGTCERILRHPIPTSYTRHTSRLVFIWTLVLPLGLWPMLGLATTPAALVLSFSMLAIEDIGVMIEEPFEILPLWRYVEDIDEAAELAIFAAKLDRKQAQEEKRSLMAMTSKTSGNPDVPHSRSLGEVVASMSSGGSLDTPGDRVSAAAVSSNQSTSPPSMAQSGTGFSDPSKRGVQTASTGSAGGNDGLPAQGSGGVGGSTSDPLMMKKSESSRPGEMRQHHTPGTDNVDEEVRREGGGAPYYSVPGGGYEEVGQLHGHQEDADSEGGNKSSTGTPSSADSKSSKAPAK
eukprot:CAMPEP_0184499954 /NCGR_PEP_ID=MMETSP0113_2-20130426/43074_1 /TAXON_ID=91329 /ORGANISM="Norrisiella sphaerica, Strain BC52" /LENGTH=684 /DNA_ID=CAMNT_0026888093 /DNA_START=113 /DNA_END=2167 /DNA_ORIENTATION=+